MSIAVPLADLPDTLTDYPWAYLVTLGRDAPTGTTDAALRAHARAVPTEVITDPDGRCRLRALVGGTTLANIARHPAVTMLFPHPDPGGFSLIVDGRGSPVGDPQPGGSPAGSSAWMTVEPTSAVLHRPASR